jgi:transposase
MIPDRRCGEERTMLIIGVDAHKTVHAAVALDNAGREVDQWRGANRLEGWEDLRDWARALDAERQWGIEGAGQYGRGLAQLLVAGGAVVWEVNPRQTAAMRRGGRQRGKTDRLDALAVARVVRQEGNALPRVQREDETVVLDVVVEERAGALAAATRARNQLHQVLHQLDPDYRQRWPDLTDLRQIEELTTVQNWGPGRITDTRAATVRRLAARLLLAETQAEEIKAEIERIAVLDLQPLIALKGVGALRAGMLAAELGPGDRFASDAQLAMHAGVAPVEASSGPIVRHRLNRAGNRQLNALFHGIAQSQAQHHPPAQAYLARRRSEGKTEREAIRALCRYLARTVWHRWRACLAAFAPAPPRLAPHPLT